MTFWPTAEDDTCAMVAIRVFIYPEDEPAGVELAVQQARKYLPNLPGVSAIALDAKIEYPNGRGPFEPVIGTVYFRLDGS